MSRLTFCVVARVASFDLVELPDGRKGKRWENGSVTDAATGHIIVPSRNAVKIVTSEDARTMANKRHAKRQAVIEKHVKKATGAFSTDAALGKIAAKRARVALNDDGRAGNDAAKFVFLVLDALPEKKKELATVVHQHELSDRSIALLTEIARNRDDPDFEYLDAEEA